MSKFKKYTDEQLKEMSLTELAYIYMTSLKKPVSFNRLTDVVFEAIDDLDSKEKKMGQFYTDLTIDGRFVTFSNGRWDLRYRHRFEAFDLDDELILEVEMEPMDETPLEITINDDDYEGMPKTDKIDVDMLVQRTASEEEADDYE
ncbi:MAG: DNA-directed RNA polymerase subunit delta [Culicoidibacterales bacterium]